MEHRTRQVSFLEYDAGYFDLRRTCITNAESLDVPPYAIKHLVKHKMTNDVTDGYIVSDVERLRRLAQLIGDFLERAFIGEARHIVSFPVSRTVASESARRDDVR
jgi:hypothetical protein